MKKLFMAFMAMCAFLGATLFTSMSFAAPPISGDSLDFGVTSVYEEPGTYPPVIHVYGGSTRSAVTSVTEFGVLTSSDNFATAASWQPLTGVVGYVGGALNTAFVICPPGQTCGGYKAFYITDDSSGKLYRCTGLAAWKDLSGCALFSVAGMTVYDIAGIGLSQDGNNLLVGGKNVGDTHSQIYSINIAAATSSKLSACTDALISTIPTGSVVGSGSNQYLYVSYNDDYYRFTWTGTTCSGAKQKIVGTMGWDDSVNTVSGDYYAAVGNITGSFYFAGSDFVFKLSKKDLNCGDSFISLTEKCDPIGVVPLNLQTCSSIGLGFTAGSLGCNPGTCNWDTSSCTSPAVCGNGTKEAGEVCDGSDFGGATCASVKGIGWTGSLVCIGSCSTIDSSGCSAPPPVCGNGTKEGGEVCDSPDFGGKTCVTEKGAGWTGSLTCTGSCSTIGTGSCVAPPLCGNGVKEGVEACDGLDLGSATCASVMGAGYIGSLSCVACAFVTSACTLCGNGTIDGGEVCDGLLFGGKTCATEKGAGWTGALSCISSCSSISTAGCSPPAPFCGDTVCNGGETCSSCPSDCGMCCGNGVIDAGEVCDDVALGGATCTSILGAGYSGSVTCKVDCSFNTSSCVAPVTCGNSVLDVGEQCDGTKFGTHTCVTEKGDGYSGSLTCTSMCVIDNSGCTPPPWGVKVASGDCKIVGADPLNAAIQTAVGICQFSFIAKNGVIANDFTVEADSVKLIAFVVAELPTRSAFTVPQGVVWTELDSKGNKKQFIYGAGVVMGDEGTGFVFDTKSKYPIVTFKDTDKTICFGKDHDYAKRFSDIDVGNGVGCLTVTYDVEINAETQTVTKAPWKDGTVDAGDGGTDAGDSGSDTGAGGGDSGTGGDAGPGTDASPPPGDGGGGGCSCAIPGREGFPLSGAGILALALIALGRRRTRSAS